MQRSSLEECYRLLELPESATTEEIRAAFRRLARQYHPDGHPRRRDHRRFVEVANAYRILREKLRARPPDSEWGPCPRCGQFSDILVGLDGRKSCPDCLLGITQRRRILPKLFIPVAKHVATLTLYGASVFFLFAYLESGAMRHVAISLACVVAGLLILIAEVLHGPRRQEGQGDASERSPPNTQALGRTAADALSGLRLQDASRGGSCRATIRWRDPWLGKVGIPGARHSLVRGYRRR
jgi:hypothetical protein